MKQHARGALLSHGWRARWAIGIGLFLFALNNLVVGPILEAVRPNSVGVVLLAACLALVGAQLASHAVWCVLAPYSRVRRIGVAVGTATLLIGAWILGMILSDGLGIHRQIEWEVIRGVLCLPLLALAIQSPLWAAKYWLEWRIMLSSSDCEPTESRAFGIRDLLIATAIGASVLSAARLAVPLDTPTEQFLLPMVLIAVVLAFVSLSTTIPVVLAALHVRRIEWTIAALLLYCPAFTIATISVIIVIGPQDTLLLRLALASLAGSYLLGLAACMLVARGFGWRLVSGQNRKNRWPR